MANSMAVVRADSTSASSSARQAVRVAEFAHRGIGDLGHGRRGGDRGAADRTEAGAGAHRRHGEAAAQMTDAGIGRPEQLLRHAGARNKVAHYDGYGHHRE